MQYNYLLFLFIYKMPTLMLRSQDNTTVWNSCRFFHVLLLKSHYIVYTAY